MRVKVFNPELGSLKYVGHSDGYVSCNGFVLVVVIDENGIIRCEQLTHVVAEREKQDERNEKRDGGLVPRGETVSTGIDHTRADGRGSRQVTVSASVVRPR